MPNYEIEIFSFSISYLPHNTLRTLSEAEGNLSHSMRKKFPPMEQISYQCIKQVEQVIGYPDPPASLRHITASFLLVFSSNLTFSLAGLQVVALG